ncbi:2-keto-4-pentenoate hydratase/2-oxohepta-3-ene-1,7-dioic acid hydratase (catechol pathway) [Pedococcus dokdonensis]|uniref:2-keto-4-pentenoate hydratase/2-oxohepta-3-ene-1,7-dioic acid hydratase (Catechol pathway) n=1 Tax=Pedococcus dokdonensis TaxID=443156 RepID=A0A1H0UL26_9MICO|nr:fumarylacetoacetate hydrolase family protein [Pedococcus dokdonensis]SDP67032.1 2-keto-4-pentenoate hydratase/2-oxohepta-3-ene-1,7-dioic acid hydratase (catechol pathway) [Pedococcus dokdonensis]
MRFARVGQAGAERPVVVAADGSLLDLGGLAADLGGDFLGRLNSVDPAALQRIPATDDVRFGAPIARPGKVVGIGLNYRDHAAEARVPLPMEPVVFLKAPTSVCGPTDDIRMLPQSVSTDFEVELGVVMGRALKDERDHDRALASVAGYVLAHDVSDRALQLERGGTWTKGKSADTFCPVGPWLVTPDELGDPGDVRLRLSVNDTPRQDGSTRDMLFSVAEILCYVSGLMTLEPGDLVITGTPAGVAMGQPEPRPYLRHGDVVRADGGVLGSHRSRVVDRARSVTPAAAG